MFRFELYHCKIFSFRGFIDRGLSFRDIMILKTCDTYREVYVSTFDGSVLFVLEKYCFENGGYDNILINFFFSRTIVCAVLSYLKMYIWDFIRSKKIRSADIATWEIFFQRSACL